MEAASLLSPEHRCVGDPFHCIQLFTGVTREGTGFTAGWQDCQKDRRPRLTLHICPCACESLSGKRMPGAWTVFVRRAVTDKGWPVLLWQMLPWLGLKRQGGCFLPMQDPFYSSSTLCNSFIFREVVGAVSRGMVFVG